MKQKVLLIFLIFSNLLFSQENDFTYYITRKSDKFGILNEKGKTIVPNQYENIETFREGLFTVQQNGKYGFVNTKGELIIPCQYDSVGDFYDGFSIVILDDDFGVIDKDGKTIFPLEYDGIYRTGLETTFLVFNRNGQQYYINAKGEKLFDNKKRSIESFHNGYAVIHEGNKFGLIDTKGNIVIESKYQKLGDYSNGYSLTFRKENDDFDGLMDIHEQILAEPKYDFLAVFDNNYIAINSLKGLMDKAGKVILAPEYDEIGYSFEEGLISISKNGKYGFANEKGEIIIPMIYNGVGNFSEGMAPALKNGFWGFIDKNGKTIIDFKFKGSMKSFSNGYAEYGKNETAPNNNQKKWGFIDKKGNIVIANKYKSLNGYKKGLFEVETSKEKILIDINGKIVAKLNDTYNGLLEAPKN